MPASPSTSTSLSVGRDRDKSRQRDLPGDQLESWASPEHQVGDSHLARGSRRGAGTGEVREELTNGAGSTTESCFARQGQIRGWQRSPVCLCKDPGWLCWRQRGWHASLEAQTPAQCQMPGVFCQLCRLRAVTRAGRAPARPRTAGTALR